MSIAFFERLFQRVDLLTGKVVKKVRVPWGPEGDGDQTTTTKMKKKKKKVVGRDGKEKARRNVVSCMAWREDGWGDQVDGQAVYV